MMEHQEHPSHLFPRHGSQVYREFRGCSPGVPVHSEPPDLDTRIEAEKTAVWIRHERPAVTLLAELRNDGTWTEIPGSDKGVTFELAKGIIPRKKVERAEHYYWVCGYTLHYRRLKS